MLYQTAVDRLMALGVALDTAILLENDVDIDKVEALVLGRGCPLSLALRIALRDSTMVVH
jgi:hypothetical protein